jgi:hypothetical protein
MFRPKALHLIAIIGGIFTIATLANTQQTSTGAFTTEQANAGRDA